MGSHYMSVRGPARRCARILLCALLASPMLGCTMKRAANTATYTNPDLPLAPGLSMFIAKFVKDDD